MSVIETLHQEHKDRLARMAAKGGDNVAPKPIDPKPVTYLSPVMRPEGQMTIRRIQRTVVKHFNVSMIEMLSPRRHAKVALPRMIAIFLVKEFTSKSLPEIGRHFGGRDHTTVLHSIRKIDGLMKTDDLLIAEVEELRTKLCAAEDSPEAVLQAEVEHCARGAWLNARELEGYRRHPGAKRFLSSRICMDDLEKARDYLSRVLDDMRGIK